MPRSNTATRYGSVTRTLHWLTALLILTAIPLGIIANDMATDAAQIATKTTLFSLHKTLGVAAFLVGLTRILWALGQTHPVPLHPEKRAETLLAAIIHWLLYISLLAVPLTGWIHHAATSGFAPILWPFGQNLPLVPKSEATAALFSSAHWLFTKLLFASIVLHIAGALKHQLIDRDATLARMTKGTAAGSSPQPKPSRLPMIAAFAIYALGAGLAYSLTPAQPAPTANVTAAASQGGNWAVQSGDLSFTVQQMGSPIEGHFANWTADIQFEPTATQGQNGSVAVEIDLTSLDLGGVTTQAKSADFFDTETFATARFDATIQPEGQGYVATGTLDLHGASVAVTLPLDLQITGDTATLSAETTLDRRDFGIGRTYSDETTVGFGVTVKVALTATRR